MGYDDSYPYEDMVQLRKFEDDADLKFFLRNKDCDGLIETEEPTATGQEAAEASEDTSYAHPVLHLWGLTRSRLYRPLLILIRG